MASVIWRTEGLITRLTLNRPERLNAIGETEAAQFAAAIPKIAKEKSRVVLLEGAGSSFCGGGDLAFLEANRKRPRAALPAVMKRFYGSFLSIRALPQVTVCKMQGASFGAGLCLALACDLRAVAEDARLSFNFVKLGLAPGMAAWPLARAAFGETRARDLLFLGRVFSGKDLFAWGAASLCVPAEALDAAAASLASEVSQRSPLALRALKKETQLDPIPANYLAFEAKVQTESFKGPDIAEGVAAIRERRAPRFP